MKKLLRFDEPGFTLLEILVVSTIIAVLLAAGLASYRPATQKSRDSKRKADLEQIRSALEMYRADLGEYPTTGSVNTTSCSGTIVNGGNTYMDPVPCDPKNTGNYVYVYSRTATTTYTLQATLEVDSSTGTCTPTAPRTYCVKNP
jgi:general secretion pathway protein G